MGRATGEDADAASMNDAGPVIRVFGGMGVDDNGEPVSIGGARQRRLLALLVIQADSIVSIDWLAENLWDEDDRPETAAPALRTYVSRLRHALPEVAQAWLETEPSGYRFRAPPEAIEHRRFTTLRTEARRARDQDDPLAAQVLLDEALGLWRGPPFRELEDLDWARPDIEQLGLDRLEMLEERWEAALALGRHTQITGELAAFTAEHSLRDRATRQYALALHRSGRTADGLRVINDHRKALTDQSGLDPSSGVLDLEQSLLSGDPSLDVERVGRPLRGYRLLEEIGSGAFSVVWRGVQPSVDREVAIKQIRSDLATQPEFIRRFEAEARLVARVEHPHIVPLIDYWRDPDSAYLVMRWLRGGTLEQRLDDGALTVARTTTLARQIGGALTAAHAQGVVHRDVKAANILFDELDNAFLTDFGIALEAARSGGPEAALSQGSPAYAAPEQIRRERLGPEADVFSLGVVIFECLAGELPFPGASSVHELVQRQLHDPYPLLSEVRADVPAAMVEAVATATAKNPADRFGSVEEFLDALAPDAAAVSSDHAIRVGGATTVIGAEVANPYMGLRAFDDGDADQFFGRERLVTKLVSRLSGNGVRSRCLVVVGPSGSGKSSVVRAGLIPALRAGAVPGSSDWFTTTMVPGTDPYESFEAALLSVAVDPPPSLIEQLRSGRRGILRAVPRCLAADEDRAIVVIDQFEELFIGQSSPHANDFLDALSVAVEDPASPLRLVVTLRADYYHRPLEHSSFARILDDAAVNVTPLAADELERAIVEPARRLNIEFEPGLAPRIAAETIGQPSPLPLLQYILSELFDRRTGTELTIEAYDQLGGLGGALAARAESLYADANDAERTAIRRIFGHMTDPGEQSADLRRRVPLADLRDDDETTWVLEHFGAARLVTFDRDVGTREPTVEVAHEALLREWPRLVTWLTEDAEILRSVDAVRRAATAWDQGGREDSDLYRGGRLESAIGLGLSAPGRLRSVDDTFIMASRHAAEAERRAEQRRVRRLRQLVTGVGIALVIAVVAGTIAFRQRNDAESAADQAESATLISRSAEATDPQVSILLALEAHRRSPGPEADQAILAALGGTGGGRRIATFPRLSDRNCGIEGWIARDGMTQTSVRDGLMVSRDLVTGVVTEHGPVPEQCAQWHGDETTNRRYALSGSGDRLWLGPYDGDWEVELELDSFSFTRPPVPFGASRLLLYTPQDTRFRVTIFDAVTGDVVGDPLLGLPDPVVHAFNRDETHVAVGYGEATSTDDTGTVLVLDLETGTELLRTATGGTVQALAFDDAAGELLAATTDGRIITIDLATGQPVAEADIGSSAVSGMGVRRDGLVTVISTTSEISEGKIELVDRQSGPIAGSTVVSPELQGGYMRADEKVLTWPTSFRVDVLDLDGGALVGQTFDLDYPSVVEISSGRAGIGARDESNNPHPELIDLATGNRFDLTLVTPEGMDLDPLAVFPQADGILTVTRDLNVARWENGQMVERVDAAGDTEIAPVWATTTSDRLAIGGRLPDETAQVFLLNTLPGELAVLLTTEAADSVVSAFPAPGDGLFVVHSDGTLRTYDSEGSLTDELATGLRDIVSSARDEISGKLAFGGFGGVVIVEPATEAMTTVPTFGFVGSVEFARGGDVLAIGSIDGTVRLWDVARGVSRGVLWQASAPVIAEWYDASTDSLWVNTEQLIVNLPLDPAVWVGRACETVGRDFTQDEWDRLVPGGGPVKSACT